MSILVHTNHSVASKSPARTTLLTSAFRIARAVLGWPIRVHANRMLLRQLAAMSPHELADIGLTPLDLGATAALPLDTEIGQFLSTRVAAHRRAWNDRRT
jgi:uncharacterized protein YjiS (DUF1127 family)